MITSRMFDYAHFYQVLIIKLNRYINTENHGNAEYLFRCRPTTSSIPDSWDVIEQYMIHQFETMTVTQKHIKQKLLKIQK